MLGNPVSCRGHNHITYKYRLKGDSFIFIKLTQTSNSSADSLLRFVVLGLVFFRGCFKLPADRQTVMFNVDTLQSWTFGTTCSYGLCIELSAHQWDSVGMFQIPEKKPKDGKTPEAMNLLWSASYADTVYQSCHSRLWSSTDFWMASFVHQWLYNIN